MAVRFFIIDESRIIQGAGQGYPTKKYATRIMQEMLVRRKKRGQKSINREFNRSLYLKVEKGSFEIPKGYRDNFGGVFG